MRTPTPSQYPVLENRPIDQWKVTELKEELKRRRLKTGGLKDDLIRRLDDALRAEMEVAVEETNVVGGNDNGVGYSEPEKVVDGGAAGNVAEGQTVFEGGDSGVVGFGYAEGMMGNTDSVMGRAEVVMGNAEEVVGSVGDFVGDAAKKDEGTADANVFQVEVDVKDSGEHIGIDESVNEQQSGLVKDPLSGAGVMTATDVASVVMGDEVNDGFFSDKTVGGESLLEGKTERDNGVSGEQQRSEDILPAHEDVKLDSSDQNNQVSEVSTSLGFPVKSNNSVSTDSLSINEKNDLKDDLIADNVKLESDVKPEMVQPSSSDIVPDGGASHPSDVDKPHDNKVSVEVTENTVANADMSQKNYSADLASEKLNLDRSSGDDSMEEDALESKQIDSKYNSEDVGAKTEKIEVAPGKAESLVATTMDTDLPAENKVINEQKNDAAILPDKRKLSDEEVVLNNKPAKRQHRWKTESKSVTEPQISPIPPPASAEDLPHSAALRRSFSRSDSIGANDPPKEREVPPSSKPATNSLRIDRFLRPFTLKAVQELLGKTGTVTSFWMDHIKTHCFVTYSSVEEAEETRNAVYNLQWPPNGGRQLLAEFVEPEEVKLRLEPPPPPAAPEKSAPPKASEPPTIPQPSPRQPSLRQPMAQQPTLPPPPPIPNQAPVREWAAPPPPPPIEKVDAPIVTLDDLFRKTKAMPRIYYLPLTDEQVAAKVGNSKQ